MQHEHFSNVDLKIDDPEAAIVNRNCGEEESEHGEQKHPEDELVDPEHLDVFPLLNYIILPAAKEAQECLIHLENEMVEVGHHSVDKVHMERAEHEDIVDH